MGEKQNVNKLKTTSDIACFFSCGCARVCVCVCKDLADSVEGAVSDR